MEVTGCGDEAKTSGGMWDGKKQILDPHVYI